MKTKITMLLLFLVTLQSFAQINRNYKKGVSLKHVNAQKLPLLQLKKYNQIPKNINSNFNKNFKATRLSVIPKPIADGTGVLSATLSPESMRARNAHLLLFGKYDGETISIEKKRNSDQYSYLMLYFKGVRDKVYRITMNIDADFDPSSANLGHLNTRIYEPAAGYGAVDHFDYVGINIYPGNNKIDFLVQSTQSGELYTSLLSTGSIYSRDQVMQNDYTLKINEVKIRQLQD